MPSNFSAEEVAAVAALANLELDAAERELFAQQLAAILAYADEVLQVDTTGVAPTTAVITTQPVDRPDEVRPSLPIEATLANAPDADRSAAGRGGGFFRVPRVIG
jgi:aspartyl-tRNA(Asn)/glutamyl-tRNA(Gln) amidotransferase subunit C